VGEAGAPQQVLDLIGGAAGRARRGAGAAGLGCDGNAPAGCEPPAQLGEPFGGRGPEPEGVDGEDGVEGAVEGGRKLIDRCIDQGDRLARMAAALRLDACRSMTSEWSMPYT
jgi:hypothetical protein